MKNEVLGHTIIRVLNALHSMDFKRSLTYIETGTCKDLNAHPGDPEDARSTLAVARWVRNNYHTGHRCFSIDLHAKHLNIAKQVLERENLSVFEFIEEDGAKALQYLGNFRPNLVLLDADSEFDSTYREYKSIIDFMDDPAFMLIDDINRNGVNKGKLILEERTRLSLPWKMVARYVAVIPFGVEAVRMMKFL